MLKRIVMIMALAALVCAMAAPAMAKLEPKIDDFIILIDKSASMGRGCGKVSRFVDAKNMVTRMNELIPELGYKGSLCTIAKFGVVQPLQTYSTAGYAKAIDKLPADVSEMWGDGTALGRGFAAVEKMLPPKGEKTAVILFTDGGENEGYSPLGVVNRIKAKYGNDVCIYVVSYANTTFAGDLLTSINKAGACGELLSAKDLAGQAALQGFVERVFYNVVPDEVVVEEVIVVETVVLDSDGDGVPDNADTCPDTPAGLVVDENGCPIPVIFRLDIEFDFDKATVRPQYHNDIEAVAKFMNSNSETSAVIAGYTDSTGTAEYNMGLSKRRAASVKAYMVDNFGVAADRLTTVGYGETRPVASNDTREGRQKNRRVNVNITGAYETK